MRSILVVDDNGINRVILNSILKADYEVLEAVNGSDALVVLNEQYDKISAVLLDILMPVMDGYELLTVMKKDNRLSQIPVIMTTGDAKEGTEVKALSLGATDFITKPYNAEVIKHRIRNTINM